MAIEAAIVTIDAMGCQREIAEKILEKKADYVLALKGTQGTLREDVEVFITEEKATGFKDTNISSMKRSTAITVALRRERTPQSMI
jgi:predicted transposase YbfD/YdcC